MAPIRTNPTGSRLPTAWKLLSTLRAALEVKGLLKGLIIKIAPNDWLSARGRK